MFEIRPYRRNQLAGWNPFAEMEELEKRFFGSGLFDARTPGNFRTDITDEGASYELRADLPGFNKEDIHLDLSGDNLTISAERHSEHEEQDQQGKFVRCERSYGSFSRSFDVSEVDAENIRAKYENGVLTLTLPKRAQIEEQPKRLMIE